MKDNANLSRLLERAKAKDDEAFVELYNLFSKHVYYNAIKIVGNADDALDVLQDVMLQFYNNLEQIQKPASMSTYLYRITYNVSIDLLRKKKNAELLLGDDELPAVSGRERRLEFLPQEYAESRENQEYVLRKLDEMHPTYRAILVMFYYNGLSIKEIARVLDATPNAVRVKLQRSREALKREIERDSREEGALLRAMSLPVLSTILKQNADSLFTPEIAAKAWQGVSAQLGISAAASAASTAAAASASAPGIAATATGVKVVAALVAGSVAVAGVWGAGHAISKATGGDGLWPFRDGADNTAISSGDFAGVDEESPERPLSGDVPGSGDEQLADGGADPHMPSDSAGADEAPAEPSAGSLALTADVLYYPVGVSLDLATIYRDAGVTGIPLEEAEALFLDDVDTSAPNEYGILLIRAGSQPYEDYTLAIVVVIE